MWADFKKYFQISVYLRVFRYLVLSSGLFSSYHKLYITKKRQFKNSTVVQTFFPKPNLGIGLFGVCRENLDLLTICTRKIGWRKFIFSPDGMFFDLRTFPYFNIPKHTLRRVSKETFCYIDSDKWDGGFAAKHKKYELRLSTNVAIEVLPADKFTLNFFNIKCHNLSIEGAEKNSHVQNALMLVSPNGQNFQHFVLEILPLLAMCQNYLQSHPEITILLSEFDPNFREFAFYFELLDLPNTVKTLSYGERLEVKSLFSLNVNPFFSNCLNPAIPLTYLQAICQMEKFEKATLVIYLLRKSATRILINQEQITERIKEWTEMLNLEFMVMNQSDFSRREIFDLMTRAQFVFGVHGGDLLNCIGMQRGSFLTDFIQTDDTISLNHYFQPLGINYTPIVTSCSRTDTKFNLDLSMLSSHLMQLEKLYSFQFETK